jgi:hypothetical protein
MKAISSAIELAAVSGGDDVIAECVESEDGKGITCYYPPDPTYDMFFYYESEWGCWDDCHCWGY